MDHFCRLALDYNKTSEGFYFLENGKPKTLLDLLAANQSLRISSFEDIKENLLAS